MGRPRGPAVSAIRISWTPTKRSPQQALDLSADPFARFPQSGRIAGTPWELIVREQAPGKDPDFVGAEYASWCIRNKIPLGDAGIKSRFTTFCGGMDNPPASRGKRATHESWETDPEAHEISPYSEFPRNGLISNTVFADLVGEHAAAGSDPDEIGPAYVEYLNILSPKLLERPRGIPHESDFTEFCKGWTPARPAA